MRIRNFFMVMFLVVAMGLGSGCATKQVMGPDGQVQEIPVGGQGKAVGATVAGIGSTALSLLYKGNNRWVRALIPVAGTLAGLAGGHAYDMAQADKEHARQQNQQQQVQQQQAQQFQMVQQQQRLQQMQSSLRLSAPVSVVYMGQSTSALRSAYELANVLVQIPDGEPFEVATRTTNVSKVQKDFQAAGYYLVGQTRKAQQKGISTMTFKRAVPQQVFTPVTQQNQVYRGL